VVLVIVTFLSYAASDKVMVWILANSVFGIAYAYTKQKEVISKFIGLWWNKAMEIIQNLLGKIPKAKAE
jgi:hypothetical protein